VKSTAIRIKSLAVGSQAKQAQILFVIFGGLAVMVAFATVDP
jgi:hypothetical protein